VEEQKDKMEHKINESQIEIQKLMGEKEGLIIQIDKIH